MLGMPGYGTLTPGAARGFWHASQDADQVIHVSNEGSLLAANFNYLWCAALNFNQKMCPLDYFAMQHADVEPEDCWLDFLVEELEQNKLDVLGVAIPIKDTHGMTSIGLDHPDGNTWKPLCRLSMAEIHRLPPTFTSADVGHKVLINTGLWVCRFSESVCRQLHFTINDRIVQLPDGSYSHQCESEDWYFSRLCHEMNLKIGVTRKIRVGHRGDIQFSNTGPWGSWDYDKHGVTRSVIPEPAAGTFEFPHDVDGWLTEREGVALAHHARGKRVLEIGSYAGRSTICLAQTAEHVTAVDWFDGRGTPEPRNTAGEFRQNVERYGVAEKITTAAPDSIWPLPRYGLAFIDGAHDYDSVADDTRKAMSMLAPGGLLAFHDYRSHMGELDARWDPGVSQAVDELIADGGEILERYDTLAIVRPPHIRRQTNPSFTISQNTQIPLEV
jgi:hypothetical protein